MTAIAKTEEVNGMAISSAAPEVAVERVEREVGERAQRGSLIDCLGYVLRRGYERVCSTIFDPDRDCMRF
jgi:hypothetical protein